MPRTKKAESAELATTETAIKKKPRGGNSPVIGDNGINIAEGDAKKVNKAILFSMQNDPYFRDVVLSISEENDIYALSSTPLDKDDVESMKKRFVGYVAFCMVNDIRFGNQMAYDAIGITKDDVYNWGKRTRGTEHSEFIKKITGVCSSYREALGAAGLLHPTTVIWWQKNYDGMTDVQRIEIAPVNPLGEAPDQKALEERINGSVVEE